MSANKLIGLLGTTLGGGLIGAGMQRTFMAGNRLSSGLSKMFGGSGISFDHTTWYFFVGGAITLLVGVFFSLKRK
jgi:hypothetical protein